MECKLRSGDYQKNKVQCESQRFPSGELDVILNGVVDALSDPPESTLCSIPRELDPDLLIPVPIAFVRLSNSSASGVSASPFVLFRLEGVRFDGDGSKFAFSLDGGRSGASSHSVSASAVSVETARE